MPKTSAQESRKSPGLSRTALCVLFFCAALATLTGYVSPPVALAAGLVLALSVGNPYPDASRKASKILLQCSVVGLGFGLSLPAIWTAGKIGFGFTLATISGTLLIGMLLGRLLKVESDTSTLVSAGTAICGGSAIAAVGAVLGAEAGAMSVALVTVFVLNGIALFIFPPLGHLLGMDQAQFGLWSAIAIHDTSSVVGAAAKYGEEALNMATTVKLARALWIIPIAMAFAFANRRKAKKITPPWFILAFLAAAGIRTLWPDGEIVYGFIKHSAKLGLTLTLFLIGAGLSRNALKKVGFRPMLQGILLWLLVSSAGLLAVKLLFDGS
ncbi:MAG: YeiH family protein [Candidatus Sumerlaeia bacterium]